MLLVSLVSGAADAGAVVSDGVGGDGGGGGGGGGGPVSGSGRGGCSAPPTSISGVISSTFFAGVSSSSDSFVFAQCERLFLVLPLLLTCLLVLTCRGVKGGVAVVLSLLEVALESAVVFGGVFVPLAAMPKAL